MKKSLFNWYLGGANAGLTYLKQNAKVFYDFTAMSGSEDDVITSVSDLSPNGRDLEGNGSPVIKLKQIGDDNYKTAETYIDSTPTVRVLQFANASYADACFNSSFEVFATFFIADGQPATTQTAYYFGMQGNASIKSALICRQSYSNPNYFFQGYYADDVPTLANYAWSTANGNPFVDGPMGQTLVRFKFDFDNNVFLMSVDGVEPSTYTIYSNISNVTTPSGFNANAKKFVLGSTNVNGTIQTGATVQMNWLRFAVTPILTSQQAADVINYLTIV